MPIFFIAQFVTTAYLTAFVVLVVFQACDTDSKRSQWNELCSPLKINKSTVRIQSYGERVVMGNYLKSNIANSKVISSYTNEFFVKMITLTKLRGFNEMKTFYLEIITIYDIFSKRVEGINSQWLEMYKWVVMSELWRADWRDRNWRVKCTWRMHLSDL